MGGKKQSQRTKNNARPSSSGRSALLLSNAKLETGVMNVNGTELPALFPTLVAPNIDPLVSPELQLCIKKLNKKDPITKTKALQELSELVSNSKVDDVVAVLPSWAHFYKILTSDPDRKVREATQWCHGVIVSACGRRVAPQLRQLVPAWLQAQYDDHAPAAAHAQHSLAKTFPDNKLPEVLSFCKDEILAHLVDNLIANGETAFIRKSDTAEQRALQASRVVSGSLHGAQYAARHLPAPHAAWLWGRLQPLLRPAAFWKRAADPDPKIRAAWYGAVGSLAERFGATFAAQYGQKTLRALLAQRDAEPRAAASLWDCLLLFMHSVEDWHKYLDKKELLVKRILDVLENGGWGDARHLSNMLLPLLAHLPDTILTKEFYISFFDAMFNGLDKKTILSSKSERQSWITSLAECLRYLSIQQHDYVLEIVTSVHRTWLEKVLSDTHDGQIKNNLIKHSAQSMAALVKYWLKQASEGPSEKYDQLIRNYWQNVGATISSQIDKLSTNHTDVCRTIDAHILLLQTLKTSFVQEAKRQYSITFNDSPTDVEIPKSVKQTPCDPAIVDRYEHNLNDLIEKVCGHYFEFASEKQISSPVLTPLITLLIDFDSERLFMAVARQFNCDSPYKLYEKVLRSWLAGDTMRCRAVVDIVFLLLKHLNEEEQDALLDSFKQFPPSVIEWCISLSLSHTHCKRRAVRRWLRGGAVTAAVRAAARRVIDHGDAAAREVLLMCCDTDDDGELIISPSAVTAVVEQLSAALESGTAPRSEAAARLAARLAERVSDTRLLLALFQLTLRTQMDSSALSPETSREVVSAWREGLNTPTARTRAAAAIHRHLNMRSNLPENLHAAVPSNDEQNTKQTLNINAIEHALSLCPFLLSNTTKEDVKEIADFTECVFDIAPSDPFAAEAFAIRHSVVRGEINCPFGDSDVTNWIINDCTKQTVDEINDQNLMAYLRNCVFKSIYLRAIFLHKTEDSDETWCNVLLSEDYFVTELCKVLHDSVVVSSLCKAYAFSPYYNLLNETTHNLNSMVEDIISECAASSKARVLKALTEAAAVKGYFWAFTATHFDTLAKLGKQKEQESTSRQQDTENAQENTENRQESAENRQENTENRQEKTERSQSETESAQDKTEECESQKSDESKNIESLDFGNIEELITGSGYFHTLQATEGRALHTRYLLMLRCYCAAHAPTAAFLRDVTATRSDSSADVIVNAYYDNNDVMLYEMDVTSSPWAAVACNAAVCDYLSTLVSSRGWALPAHHWDFLTITLCNLLTSVRKSVHAWGSSKVSMLARSVLELYSTVEGFISSVPAACLQAQPAPHVAHLPQEWADIFAPDLRGSLMAVIMFVLESSSKTSVTSNHIAVMDSLIRCARHLPDTAPAGGVGSVGLTGAVCVAVGVLAEPAHHSFKYLAYELVNSLLKPMVLDDASLIASWSAAETPEGSESEGAGRSAPQLSLMQYDEAFCHLRDLVTTATAHVKVCETTCSLAAPSDVHSLAVGWLLLADLIAAHCKLARGDLKHHYIEIYRERKWTEPLLTTALRLIPAEVLAHAQLPAAAAPPPLQAHVDMFNNIIDRDVYKYCGGSFVFALACRAARTCLCGAGAGDARGWRGAAPHRHATALDNLVRAYITPSVVKEEFTLVQQRASELEDTEITIHWSTYELNCILTVEERPIELRVALSRSHPLGLPKLTAPEHAPAGNTNWLVMYMGYQNGTLLNALKMWISAVNSKVERSAQCYICYCRLHFATGRLPAVLCHQCRNRFHTACLRKWFATSNKSNCPLCRTSF